MKRHLCAGAVLVCSLAAAVCHAQAAEFAISYPDRSDAAAHANPMPHGTAAAHAGSTHEIAFDERRGGDLTFHSVPTRNTVMHRIIRGPDGNLWFTEMHSDKVGRLTAVRARR